MVKDAWICPSAIIGANINVLLRFPWKCLFWSKDSILWLVNISPWYWQIITQGTHFLVLLQLCVSTHCFCESLNREMGEGKQELLQKQHRHLKGSARILSKSEKLFYHTNDNLLKYLFSCSFKFSANVMMIFATSSFILNKYLTFCSTCKSYANQHYWVGL